MTNVTNVPRDPRSRARSNVSHDRVRQQYQQQYRTYDTTHINPRKKSKAPVIAALLIALIVLGAAGVFVWKHMQQPQESTVELLPVGQSAVVVVNEGEGAGAIGATLKEAHLVESVTVFLEAIEARNAAASLIPGTYLIEGGTSVDGVIDILLTGPSATSDVLSVPEGLTREETAQLVEAATEGRVTVQQFLDMTADASAWVGEFPFLESAGTNSLEGFLFPKTYLVNVVDDATTITRMMLNQFQVEIAELSFAYPESLGMTLYDAVNLASIVEREVISEDDRANASSVFYNRLNSDYPYLESDATTAYEVGGEPTAAQVHADTPYSTYANPGLPPTPICSPSFSALSAICYPPETDYWFFYCAMNDEGVSVTYFSKTYEEHQRAIANA